MPTSLEKGSSQLPASSHSKVRLVGFKCLRVGGISPERAEGALRIVFYNRCPQEVDERTSGEPKTLN